MSYHHRTPSRVVRPYGLGFDLSDLFDPSKASRDAVDAACSQTIQTSSAQLETARNSVVQTLQARTFYTVADLDAMVQQVWSMLDKMKNELTNLRNEDWGAAGAIPAINEERLQLLKRFSEGTTYVDNINYAKTHGIDVVDAPGFWRWVEKSLIEVELATGLISYVACKKPIWLSVVQAIYAASQVLINLARKAVNTVIAAGKLVLQIPDAAAALWTALKWGTLIGGGLFLAYKIRERQRKR